MPCGLLTFADDVAVSDYVNCLAMGFDPEKIPLVRNAFRLKSLPITDQCGEKILVNFCSETYPAYELLTQLGLRFTPPQGWVGHIELTASPTIA